MNWNFTEHRRSVLGVMLIGIGAVLLAAQIFGNMAGFLWPLFIVVPGAALMVVGMASDGWARNLAIPGTVIGGIGLILFLQNTFNHYESWAYAWALIPFFVGFGTMIAAEGDTGTGDPDTAHHLMKWSITVFLILAALFEFFIFGGGGMAARIVVPILLIAAGAVALFGQHGDETGEAGHDQEAHPR